MLSSDRASTFWYLEGFVDSRLRTWRTLLRAFPLVVGRSSKAGLSLTSEKVSNRHAELFRRGDGLWIRDLGSTNGTFVNFHRVEGEVELREGDILSFADLGLRLSHYLEVNSGATVAMSTRELEDFLERRSLALAKVLEHRTITSHFQPLVAIDSGETMGFEILSRAEIDGSLVPPAELFAAAERLGVEESLSQLCRTRGLVNARPLDGSQRLFVNTHPRELAALPELIASLEVLGARHPERKIVVEVHEAAATDAEAIGELRRALDRMGMELAFDDFGAGQSRIREIAEAPPDYIKCDHALVRDIDQSPTRLKVVADLVQTVRSIGVEPIAEGVETEAEANALVGLGFRFAQGFYFGHPAPVKGPDGA